MHTVCFKSLDAFYKKNRNIPFSNANFSKNVYKGSFVLKYTFF